MVKGMRTPSTSTIFFPYRALSNLYPPVGMVVFEVDVEVAVVVAALEANTANELLVRDKRVKVRSIFDSEFEQIRFDQQNLGQQNTNADRCTQSG